MPASKRRRAAASKNQKAAVAAPPAEVVTAPAARPSRPAPARSNTDPDNEPRWTPLGLLVLLSLAFAVQLPIGALIHLISHTNLLIIDLFFFQSQYVLLACFLMMPVARIVTRQPRTLRWLESLSLGAVYALLAVLLASVLVHPNTSGSVPRDHFIKSLQVSDGLRIAFGDVLALFGTVAIFPRINRVLGAPGRRARRRMLQRSAPGARPGRGSDRSSKRGAKPRR